MANLSENGRKVMVSSVYIVIITIIFYHNMFVYKLTTHIPG